MGAIILSKKYGLNSSVEICHVCGKEMDIVLFGASYKDENGKSAEAPSRICMGNICDDCKKVIEDGASSSLRYVMVRGETIHTAPVGCAP